MLVKLLFLNEKMGNKIQIKQGQKSVQYKKIQKKHKKNTKNKQKNKNTLV